jgi:hypothetical protein
VTIIPSFLSQLQRIARLVRRPMATKQWCPSLLGNASWWTILGPRLGHAAAHTTWHELALGSGANIFLCTSRYDQHTEDYELSPDRVSHNPWHQAGPCPHHTLGHAQRHEPARLQGLANLDLETLLGAPIPWFWLRTTSWSPMVAFHSPSSSARWTSSPRSMLCSTS